MEMKMRMMEMKMRMKDISHRYNITRPKPRYGYKYSKYKKCEYDDAFMC